VTKPGRVAALPHAQGTTAPRAAIRPVARVRPDVRDSASAMLIPVVLILIAVLCGGVVAYGTHPVWAQYDRGVDFIMAARRVQWPLVALSIILCLALIALVISGRRRAWWLIGLAPVLVMFVHRFASDPYGQLKITDDPAFIAADAAEAWPGEMPVVGVQYAGGTFAYPVAALDRSPVIIQAVHEKHLMLLWSPAAGRATASAIERQLKARDLEIVSAPAGTLLVYDGRLGQFITVLTGQTPQRQKPVGFLTPVPTARTTWKQWHTAHPDTTVMTMPPDADKPLRPLPDAPLPPVMSKQLAPETSVTIISGGKRPIAVLSKQVTTAPLNVRVGEVAALIFRDPQTGELRAFDRRLEEDLIPTFRVNRDPKRKGAAFYDPDTASGWDVHGVVVAGKKEFKDRRLQPLQVEEGLPWGIMKYWYPELELVTDKAITTLPVDEAQPSADSPTQGGKVNARKPRARTPAR